MIIEPTPLAGLFVVPAEKHADPRGYFARLWCREEFGLAGIAFAPVQVSLSYNERAGTLRGLHWQVAPHSEGKLVRVVRGSVWDVAVDLRADSATRFRWFGIELDAERGAGLFIPAGFAHGFVTLSDSAEVLYCIDVPYAADSARGARFDDPACGIVWPRAAEVISERDLGWPALEG
jgi:dTDP-4-dehydrorhamnose 3,5-epimerase